MSTTCICVARKLIHDIGEKEYEFCYLGFVRVKPLLVLETLIEEAEELNFYPNVVSKLLACQFAQLCQKSSQVQLHSYSFNLRARMLCSFHSA